MILPRQSAPGDYSHYLFAMGGMGESTGYPAAGVSRLVCGMAFGGTALAAVGMSAPAAAATCGDWPSYRTFVERFVQVDGRVIDFSTASQQTTSEGQSYAMFFALVACLALAGSVALARSHTI